MREGEIRALGTCHLDSLLILHFAPFPDNWDWILGHLLWTDLEHFVRFCLHVLELYTTAHHCDRDSDSCRCESGDEHMAFGVARFTYRIPDTARTWKWCERALFSILGDTTTYLKTFSSSVESRISCASAKVGALKHRYLGESVISSRVGRFRFSARTDTWRWKNYLHPKNIHRNNCEEEFSK